MAARATAFVTTDLDPGLAITVAHSFLDDDGAPDTKTLAAFDQAGNRVEAELIWIDLEVDLALLVVDDSLTGSPLADWGDGEPVRMGAFDTGNEPPVLQPLTVGRRTDITIDGSGGRPALELSGPISRGDSGAPVFNDNDEIVGIVFASSNDRDGGWATDSAELRPLEDLDTASFEPVAAGCRP